MFIGDYVFFQIKHQIVKAISGSGNVPDRRVFVSGNKLVDMPVVSI